MTDTQALPRILVVGYRQFGQLMNSVLPEFRGRAEIRIVEHLMATDFSIPELVQKHGADVVVSAGANAAYLAATLDVPVLSLPVTDHDIVEAVAKAREVSRHIVVIGYGEENPLLKTLARLLDLRIDYRSYHTADEAREQFLIASRGGIEVLVGASLVCELAEREGIAAMMIYSRHSCRTLLESAIARAAEQAAAEQGRAWREALLEDPRIPTVLLDPRGAALAHNRAAAQAFNLGGDGGAAFARALDGARDTLEFGEQRWSITRSGAGARGAVLRFLPDRALAVARRRTDAPGRTLVFASTEMQRIEELLHVYATAPGTVLIRGESGTGKELVARQLHRGSAYAAGEMVAVNCGAIPEDLFESEFFGYVEGAFTSSRRGGRRGLLEQAQGGVMFLDEIGEMPLGQQAKLLRVLEERRVRPLGANHEIALDIKVIAATNSDLRERVRGGTFREDLFYRLNVFALYLPPLRERPRDIPEIARYLLGEFAARYAVRVDVDALYALVADRFAAYPWPGNVRELENFLERLVVSAMRFTSLDSLRDALPMVLHELYLGDAAHGTDDAGALREQERKLIREAMHKFGNDRTRVAEYLGISQTTLWRRLKDGS